MVTAAIPTFLYFDLYVSTLFTQDTTFISKELYWQQMLLTSMHEVNRIGELKGELNPKIKFVLFERTLKITE